jgi:protein TonB
MFNNSSNLYDREWLALVFSKRNQNYGAYVLRMQSSNILLRSLLIVAPVFVLFFVGPMIYAKLQPEPAKIDNGIVVTIAPPDVIHEMKKEEPKKIEAKKELQKTPPAVKPIKSVNLSANIKVVEDPVKEPPTTKEVENSIVASKASEGVEGKGNIETNVTKIDGGSGNGTGDVIDNTVYSSAGVEVYPEFPGGMAAWAKFIQKNLSYPYQAQENNVQGKVFLSFVVEKDGSITDVKIVRGIGYGCDEEAVRVIKKSPKWNAGKQNNAYVRVRYNMPINYTLN